MILDRRLDIDTLLVPRLVCLIFSNRRLRQSDLLVEAVDLSIVLRDLLFVKIPLDLRVLRETRMWLGGKTSGLPVISA